MLYVKTILFSVLTLGIYSFWGRTAIRRYLFSSVKAGDDRFEYHGTGRELLIGWLKAIGIFLAFYAVVLVLTISSRTLGPIVATAFIYAAMFAFIPFVLVAAMRYRLSRTSLRGVRFGLRLDVRRFAFAYYKALFLTIVTLGLYSPWFAAKITGELTRGIYYGDQPFRFEGSGGELFKPYIVALLLLIPTLALSLVWYQAAQARYLWGCSGFRDARFECTMQGRDLLVLALTNILIIVVTLGLGIPWATLRALRYSCETLTLQNFAGFDRINQSAMAASASGEGAAALFDLDTGIGDIGM